MPTLSRYFLKGGFLCLAIGMLAGALILVQKGTGRFPMLWILFPAHTFLVMVGGMSQCALGVCYWIFPRLHGGDPPGRQRLAWVSYGTLTAAIILITLHPLIELELGSAAATTAFRGAGVLQAAAALAFVIHIWPRIRASDATPRRIS
jgi:hypothetical protein